MSRHTGGRNRIKDDLLDAMGDTVRRWLSEDDVTDIILNPPLLGEADGRLWVTRLGREAEPVGFMTAEQATRFINVVAGSLNKEATINSPSVEGHLITDGSRIDGSVPPICEAPFFSIRKPASRIIPLSDYVARGQMTERQKGIIEAAVLKRTNILIVGGTGAGKTTLLNALIDTIVKLCPNHRFFIIEETVEIQCAAKNQVSTRTSHNIEIRDLVKKSLRNKPDRIVIGEARGKEMLDILIAWNTGHPGGAATIHSDIVDPVSALERVEDLMLIATNNPMSRMVARAINMIVCMGIDEEGSRRVTQIVSVKGHDGSAYQITQEA